MTFSRAKLFLTSITLFFLLSTSISSQIDTYLKNYIDSMMQIADHTKGSQKLEVLSDLSHYIAPSAGALPYMDIFENEAKRQSNLLMLSHAYNHKADYYYFVKMDNDSSLYYLSRVDSLNLDTRNLDAERLRFAIYMAKGKYSLALFHVKKTFEDQSKEKSLKEEATMFVELAYVYSELGNYEEAIVVSNKCLDIINRDPSRNNLDIKHEALNFLTFSARKTKQYDLAINLTDSMISLTKLRETVDKVPSGFYDEQIHSAILSRATTYLAINDLVKAREDLDNSKNNSLSPTLLSIYCKLEAQYYYAIGEYNRALEYIDKGLATLNDGINSPMEIQFNTIRSQILHKLNRNNEAYELLNNVFLVKDSINNEYVSSQTSEFQTIYEVDKIQRQIEVKSAQLGRSQAISIALLCISILSIGIVLIIRRSNEEKEKKNKKIYEQYLLMKSYMDEIRDQRDNIMLQNNEPKDEQTSLAEQAYKYLIETEAFKSEDLSRDDLAMALGTNRQYLINAIKEKTGKTYKDYLNSIRLDYVYQTLITDLETNIENTYMEAGFTNRRTFNRLFKDQYGMTPNELREVARAKEEMIIAKIVNLEDEE